MSKATKRAASTGWTPGPCPGCSIDVFDPANRVDGIVVHEPGCEYDRAARARRDDLRKRLDEALAASTEKRETRNATRRAAKSTNVQEDNTMSKNITRHYAEQAAKMGPALDTLNVEALVAEMKALEIPGRSKITKRADMEKAITTARNERAAENAKAAATKKPKASKASTNGETITEHGNLKVGAKVTIKGTVDLSHRADGFVGVIEAGTAATITELRKSGPGVQVVVALPDGETVGLGSRHIVVG